MPELLLFASISVFICSYCSWTFETPEKEYLSDGDSSASRQLLRIKVIPDLHLTYIKNWGNLGLVLKMKNIACISILLTKHTRLNVLFDVSHFRSYYSLFLSYNRS